MFSRSVDRVTSRCFSALECVENPYFQSGTGGLVSLLWLFACIFCTEHFYPLLFARTRHRLITSSAPMRGGVEELSGRGRCILGDKLQQRQIASCKLENFCENLCLCNKICCHNKSYKFSLIWFFCDLLQRQNSVAETKIFTNISPDTRSDLSLRRVVATYCCNLSPSVFRLCLWACSHVKILLI